MVSRALRTPFLVPLLVGLTTWVSGLPVSGKVQMPVGILYGVFCVSFLLAQIADHPGTASRSACSPTPYPPSRFPGRVLDADKVKRLNDKELNAFLIALITPIRLSVPLLEKDWRLRQSGTPEAETIGWHSRSQAGE